MKLPQLTFGKVLAGTAVALVATTGTAYAHGMVNSGDIVNGSVRSVDIQNGGVKSADILNGTITRADLKFNLPVTLGAVVTSGGTLTRGIGAVSVNKVDVGLYDVTFNQSVANCIATATSSSDAHDEAITSLTGSVARVDMEDPDAEDTQNDGGFHLIVVCPT